MNRQYSLILAVSFMIFYNVASGLNYSDCGSEDGKLNFILVQGCDTGCILKRGTNVEIIIGFTVSREVTRVAVYAFVIADKGPLPLAFLHGCETGLHCPLETGPIYNYKTTFNVPKGYPQGIHLVKWYFQDQNGITVACAQFNALFV